MGIAAHDLRNPLSAIKGYAEMIDGRCAAPWPAEHVKISACGRADATDAIRRHRRAHGGDGAESSGCQPH